MNVTSQNNFNPIIIFDKYIMPLAKIVTSFGKDQWEKFKIDFDLVFKEYINNSYLKYSRIKTLLYRTEPKYIYDFFEVPYLDKKQDLIIIADNVNNLLEKSHFLVITGTGGIGKSTLMKHLFINELHFNDLIPIYLELKDLNNLEDNYNIRELLFERLTSLGSGLKEEYLDYALHAGCFLFLLDGYDEVISNKRNDFFKKLNDFCDMYSENYYIIASRPCSEFFEFPRFAVLSACPFTKQQAISLIKKIDYDKELRERFVEALDKHLYDEYISFATNPLLLSIMLLTYDNYAEIPEKLHLFYSNAFETLYEKHDATKSGYRREMKSKLSYDVFKLIFSNFCAITYIQGKLEFDREELKNVFIKISQRGFEVNQEFFISDLVNALCLLYEDGVKLKFTHRSFQEYFTAFFLKELPDDLMSKISLGIIHQDFYRASHDSVFPMLSDMAEERFKVNVLLPIVNEFEQDMCDTDRFEYYFRCLVDSITFYRKKGSNNVELLLNTKDGYPLVKFIYSCMNSCFVMMRHEFYNQQKVIEDQLYNYLIENEKYIDNDIFPCDRILNSPQILRLFKKTWIGSAIQMLVNLKNRIVKDQKNTVDELLELLK